MFIQVLIFLDMHNKLHMKWFISYARNTELYLINKNFMGWLKEQYTNKVSKISE